MVQVARIFFFLGGGAIWAMPERKHFFSGLFPLGTTNCMGCGLIFREYGTANATFMTQCAGTFLKPQLQRNRVWLGLRPWFLLLSTTNFIAETPLHESNL